MSEIAYLESHTVYQNPKPHVHSRQSYHPGLARLPNGDLLALFMLAEAFEAPNGTTWISRSTDGGRSWQTSGPLYDNSIVGIATTDTLKPTVLRNGSIVATGYRFHRHDLEEGIAIPGTGGFQPGDNIVSRSNDGGRSWTTPCIVQRRSPELLEWSGPCIETTAGDLVGVGGFYQLPDGSNPSGPFGAVLRSVDGGLTWDDSGRFARGDGLVLWENRICEMQPGRLVVSSWAYDAHGRRHLPNQVTVSHDNGRSWSPLIDTGVMGQASNLLWLGGDRLLTIHAHRAESPGIYVRVVDFRGDRWTVLDERAIWGMSAARQTYTGQEAAAMFAALRFGQPSLLRLDADEFLACHWSIEEGQGLIRAHRLRVSAARSPIA